MTLFPSLCAMEEKNSDMEHDKKILAAIEALRALGEGYDCINGAVLSSNKESELLLVKINTITHKMHEVFENFNFYNVSVDFVIMGRDYYAYIVDMMRKYDFNSGLRRKFDAIYKDGVIWGAKIIISEYASAPQFCYNPAIYDPSDDQNVTYKEAYAKSYLPSKDFIISTFPDVFDFGGNLLPTAERAGDYN
jgi:hypothetical protein